jgi:hypothetical protein
MRTARSFGVRFAAGRPAGECDCRVEVVINSTGLVFASGKEVRFIVMWGMATLTCWDRSAVEIICFEPETFRQWVNVSSGWVCWVSVIFFRFFFLFFLFLLNCRCRCRRGGITYLAG